MPGLLTTEALEISGAVSPEGWNDNFIGLYLLSIYSFSVLNVSKNSIMVSNFVYNRPYKIIGLPSSVRSLFYSIILGNLLYRPTYAVPNLR